MQNEALYRIINASPSVTIVTDPDDRIIFHNPAARDLFGEIPEGTLFAQLSSEKPVENFLAVSKAVQLTADKNGSIVHINCRKDQNCVASVVSVPTIEGGRIIYIRDVSSQIDYILKVLQQQKTENQLSKSTHIRNGNRTEALQEIAKLSAETMELGRVNIWMIDDGFNSISSLINYDKDNGGFLDKMTLYRHQFPNYFGLLLSEEIIPTRDATTDPKTAEILDGYIRPLGIKSLIDVPVRIEGKMAGLICFEDTKGFREWTIAEQNFGIAIAQIIAQTIETHRRQMVQRELEQALSEKKLLLAEVNHRIKNNFSIISDLIRVQEEKTPDETQRKMFSEIRTRLMSMAMIHRQLYASENIGAVNFRDFLLDLAAHYRSTFAANRIEISTLLENCRLPISKAIICGLVVNELLTNACRYAFSSGEPGLVRLKLSTLGGKIQLIVADNGTVNTSSPDGFGTELIHELIGRLNAQMEKNTDNGTEITITFNL